MKILAAKICLPAALSFMALAGCATSQYGNYLAGDSSEQEIAADAVKALSATYPPGKHRLAFMQPTEDVFGKALIDGLRGAGYAVDAAAPPPDGSVGTLPAGAETIGYKLDEAAAGVVRLTLDVGKQSITRAYFSEAGKYAPAGSWTRKE
ncbi:MAG: conjugal transfer protein TrbH [Azoarcus sp.]|jgi:hypothetical protein|nr:conjugal transfer protein TrbH [Azoarcus sp.]